MSNCFLDTSIFCVLQFLRKIQNGQLFWKTGSATQPRYPVGQKFCRIYLFGVLRHFQHCTGHITTGSWKGRGNQYIEFARVLYCKVPTNGKQLPAFPHKDLTGIEPPNLSFHIFEKKFENSKWPPFLANEIFIETWKGQSSQIPWGSKISSKSLCLAWFSRYKHFCEKFKMAGQKILENWVSYSADVPCRSKNFVKIALSSTVFEIQAFLKKKFKNSKWPPFLASEIFVETWKG